MIEIEANNDICSELPDANLPMNGYIKNGGHSGRHDFKQQIITKHADDAPRSHELLRSLSGHTCTHVSQER